MTLCALPRDGDLPPVLAIVPSAVKYNWRDEAAKWAPQYEVSVLAGRKSFRWPVPGEIVLINYDILPPEAEYKHEKYAEFKSKAPDGLVVFIDEIHNCRNNSARTRRVSGIQQCAARVWGLTGTPLMNRPDQLYRVLRSIGCAYTAFGSWQTFCKLFNASRNRWGGYEWGAPLPEVPERLRRVMLRRTKSEVLPDLPPKRYQQLVVNGVDKSLLRLMDVLWEEWSEVIEGGELPPFEEFSAMRQKIAQARTPIVEEWVEPYEDAGEPIVVMSAHRSPVDALGKREGWVTITGDTSAEDRTEIVKRFQSGEYKGVACTIQAAGVGLTLTRASTMLFVDLDWTPALNLQAQDRIHRIGQESESVLYVRMTSEHPLDQHVSALIARKMELIEQSVEKMVELDPEAVQSEEQRRAAQAKVAQEMGLTPARVQAIHSGLRFLAARCDGAVEEDGVGFNKFDTRFGKELAAADHLSPKAAIIGFRMVRKYRGQLPAELLEGAGL